MFKIQSYIFLAMLLLSAVNGNAQAVTPGNNYPASSTGTPGTASYPVIQDLTNPAAYNYLRTFIPDRPMQALSGGNIRQATAFYDGLGRPLQSVGKKAHAQGYDIVEHHVYDGLGRETIKYLPYAFDLTGSYPTLAGRFHADVRTNIMSFYNGTPSEEPFTRTDYDNSPLNRVTNSYGAGHSWVGSSRGVKTNYTSNGLWIYSQGNPPTGIGVTTGYPRWTITMTTGAIPQYAGDYGTNELTAIKTTDEDGKISEVFSDKLGHVVFTRRLANSSANPLNTQPADYVYTCYVYDDMGKLRCVVPPAAAMTTIAGSVQASWTLGQQQLDGLCYQYAYDERGRLAQRKLPGKDWEYFVYDQRDRLVLSQDGNLRSTAIHQWRFTIYDGQDRPICTGIYGSDGNEDRETMQNWVNSLGTAYSANELPYYLGNYHLYNAYPPVNLAACGILSYTYYDDYSQIVSQGFDPAQFDNTGLPTDGTVVLSVPTKMTRGLVTGTKIRVMDPDAPFADRWLTAVNYYDDKGRLIQNQATNISGGLDISSNIYYFQGMLWKNILSHKNPDALPVPNSSDGAHTMVVLKTTNTANLTVSGGNENVKGITLQIDNGILYPFANYFYDHLGRIVTKQTAAANILQEYNMRGWVNHIDASNTNNTDSIHLFEENLYYDQGFNSRYYDGNIAGITWRKAGADAPTEAYGYSYDALNRLSHAEYRQQTATSSQWLKNTYDYTVSGLSYDVNGNILAMQQMVPNIPSTPVVMDRLNFTYFPGSNQTQTIEDNIPPATTAAMGLPDFKNNASSGGEYGYDPNGNTTVDKNKKITSITYNYLNRPDVITMDNQDKVKYVYDANGTRLRKIVSTAATNITDTFDYDGNFVYKNNMLQYIQNGEGRARPTVNNSGQTKFVYDYFIKDHLGNVRSTVNAEPINETYLAMHEISSANIEQLVFDNIPTVRDSKPGGGPNDHMAARLNAAESDHQVGTAIMLRAMPGDRFVISSDAYYEGDYKQDKTTGGGQVVEALMGALLNGNTYAGVPLSELPANARIVTQAMNAPNLASQLDALIQSNNNPNAPKAHLNILFFNDKFEFVPQLSNIIQIPGNLGGNGNWVVLNPNNNSGPLCCVSNGPGYVIVYVDNQSIGKDVYFDNIAIEHYTGRVQEESHYYPFGLTLSTDQAVNSHVQPIKYNSKELQSDFAINTYDFGSRFFDEQAPHWWQIDPLAENTYGESPYAYASNNPVHYIDKAGQYKTAPENEEAYTKRFPYIMAYLKNFVEADVARSNKVQDGLLSTNPNVLPETVRQIAKWGQGPEIVFTSKPGKHPVYKPNAAGFTRRDISEIQINSRYADYVEGVMASNASPVEKLIAFARFYMTLIHETGHELNKYGPVKGRDKDGNPLYENLKITNYPTEGRNNLENGDIADEAIWGTPNFKPFSRQDPSGNNPGVEGIESLKYQPGVTEDIIQHASQTEEGKKSLPTLPTLGGAGSAH